MGKRRAPTLLYQHERCGITHRLMGAAHHRKATDMAAQSHAAQRRDVAINLRATSDERNVIDRAATVLGRSRSEFMLDALYREAVDVLLDQTFFTLDDAGFTEIMDLIDNPPEPPEGL